MLELILKQMGFNPDDLKKQANQAADNFTKVVAHFNARMDVIETQNKRILTLLGDTPHDQVQAGIENHSVSLDEPQQPLQGQSYEQ